MISLGKENYSEQEDQSIFLDFTYIKMISLGKENYSKQDQSKFLDFRCNRMISLEKENYFNPIPIEWMSFWHLPAVFPLF